MHPLTAGRGHREAAAHGVRQTGEAHADRIDAFTGRRVRRYWTLGIINAWEPSQAPAEVVDAWEWCARALCPHT